MYAPFAQKILGYPGFREKLDLIFPDRKHLLVTCKDGNAGGSSIDLCEVSLGSVKLGWFCLRDFPANCGTLITYNTAALYPYLNKGIGTLLIELQEKVALDTGYTYLMGTVASNKQPYIEGILKKRNWKVTDSFINNRSFNTINVWGKNVRS